MLLKHLPGLPKPNRSATESCAALCAALPESTQAQPHRSAPQSGTLPSWRTCPGRAQRCQTRQAPSLPRPSPRRHRLHHGRRSERPALPPVRMQPQHLLRTSPRRSSAHRARSILRRPSLQVPRSVLAAPDTSTRSLHPPQLTGDSGPTLSPALTDHRSQARHAGAPLRPAPPAEPRHPGPSPLLQASLWALHPRALGVPLAGSSRRLAGTLSAAAAMLGRRCFRCWDTCARAP